MSFRKQGPETALFLRHISDIPPALSDKHKDVAEMENGLNKEFANMCEWFG